MTANEQTISALDSSVDPTYACVDFVNPVLAYASHDGSQEIYVSGNVTNGGWPVEFRYLTGYPAMAVFNGVLYLTHQVGLSGDHQLFYMTSNDTSMSNGSMNWSLDLAVPGVYLNESPGMAVFKNKLYVAHQGSDTTGERHALWYTTYDGNWTHDTYIPGVLMNGSPSLAVFHDTLYIFHQGSDSTGEAHALWYTTTTDGITWTADKNIPGVSMDNSPCAFAIGSTALYVAYKNAGAGTIGYVINHGNGWSSPGTVNEGGPICDRASPTLYGPGGSDADSLMLIYCDSNGGQVAGWPFFNGE